MSDTVLTNTELHAAICRAWDMANDQRAHPGKQMAAFRHWRNLILIQEKRAALVILPDEGINTAITGGQ